MRFPVVSINREQQGEAEPQLLNVEFLPARGMNVYQVRAFLPGRGVVPLLESPPLEAAAKLESYAFGGALLVPFANRIGGDYSPERGTVTVGMLGKPVALPANWKDTSVHGLIFDKPFRVARSEARTVHAELEDAFGEHWPSRTAISVEAALTGAAFELTVTARNTGSEPEPMSIGWHPYFRFPSGNRAQARVRIPARSRALVNNYDDMAATGEIAPVQGTQYDLSAPGGAPLGSTSLDECFLDLDETAAEIRDPAAGYGMRIVAASPEVRAIQAFSPADSNFVAIEPQFNLLDPFSPAWPPHIDTGMVTLNPGHSTVYRVRLELFRP
jgi:galactose mutarotase-like enzyme